VEGEGVRAIPTSCGFLARFQRDLASAVAVPVFTSSLMLVPLIHRMLPAGRAVGVLTVDASSLHAEHRRGAGITDDMPGGVARLETQKEVPPGPPADRPTPGAGAARQEHVAVARRMVAMHPEIGAIVLECTNMPPYAADVQTATGLPVFDITALVRMVHAAVRHGMPPRPA